MTRASDVCESEEPDLNFRDEELEELKDLEELKKLIQKQEASYRKEPSWGHIKDAFCE